MKLILNSKVLPLYRDRTIHGFISKQKAIQQLATCSPGTFLLRFSHTNPGNLVISLVSEEGKIQDKILQVGRDCILIKETSYTSVKEAITKYPKFKKLKTLFPTMTALEDMKDYYTPSSSNLQPSISSEITTPRIRSFVKMGSF